MTIISILAMYVAYTQLSHVRGNEPGYMKL